MAKGNEALHFARFARYSVVWSGAQAAPLVWLRRQDHRINSVRVQGWDFHEFTRPVSLELPGEAWHGNKMVAPNGERRLYALLKHAVRRKQASRCNEGFARRRYFTWSEPMKSISTHVSKCSTEYIFLLILEEKNLRKVL